MKGFVKSVVSLSLVLGLACAAEAKTVLNLDFLSNEGTAEHASTLFLKQYVENRTGGELQIDIYAGAQLCGNPIECFQALEAGVVHIYPATAGGIAVVYPPIAALDIPYIMPSETVAQNVLSGPFEDKLRELIYKNTDGKLLMMSLSNSAGWRNYANAKHPVKSPADLKGLKLRTVENKVQQEQEASACPQFIRYCRPVMTILLCGISASPLIKATKRIIRMPMFFLQLQRSVPVMLWLPCNSTMPYTAST